MRPVLQQGQADGLCGLYAVLNFLNRTEWRSWAPTGLWYLLDACRHFGWLTPQFLTEGFEDHQLKAILDLQFTSYRMEYETLFLSDIVRSEEATPRRELFERIMKIGGALIVKSRSNNHWLLIVKDRGALVVCDSDDAKNPIKAFDARRFDTVGDWGVVILRRERPMLELNF